MKKQWWHEKTAYQIYPKSFYDSNGDGIGDLQGIISKLDYLKDLGVDIVWLSPIYVSPLADQGYDIADYYSIDPRFGTMDDMDELLQEAKKRDMYILMDLVVNHCSDEHEWFRKAAADPEGKYGKYFYLEKLGDPVPEAKRKKDHAYTEDGRELPSNWRSYFGGPAWDYLPGNDDYVYLHVFHKKQPDLNWENPEVREEVYKMINWWLDRGLAGFRIDAIINIKKALPFKNYPADREDGLCDVHLQLHEAKGVGIFLGEMRDRTFKPHDAFTVGEVFDITDDQLTDFIGDNGYFSTMFDFAETVWGGGAGGWHENKDITPDAYRDCVFSTQKKVGDRAFISNIIENHDEPRGVSRYIPAGEANPVSKKMLATLYFLVKGLPWIYEGQEIGMENCQLESIDEVDDISAIDNYNVAIEAGVSPEEALKYVEKYGRDNARTPFQWDASENAGFTTGTPWLKMNPNYRELNLAAQKDDPDSVFNYYKKLISLRKDPRYKDTLVWGGLEPYLNDRHNVMAYLRKGENETILVIANYQSEPQVLPLPEAKEDEYKTLLSNLPEVRIEEGLIFLKGWQAAVIKI